MNADYSICSHFEKGATHLVCQDYAIHSNIAAVLCDGCSSSPNTDIGARILASLVIQDPRISSLALVSKALDVVNLLGLDVSCLDATVLWLHVDGPDIVYNIWGDGLLLAQYDDHTYSFEITYPNNAPYYLSYMIHNRFSEYLNMFGNPEPIAVETGKADSTVTPHFTGRISRDKLKWVCMFSDGINTFPQGRNLILPQLTDFKSLNGEFVKRRMHKVFKKLETKCHDDLSCIGYAALSV